MAGADELIDRYPLPGDLEWPERLPAEVSPATVWWSRGPVLTPCRPSRSPYNRTAGTAPFRRTIGAPRAAAPCGRSARDGGGEG